MKKVGRKEIAKNFEDIKGIMCLFFVKLFLFQLGIYLLYSK